MTSRYESRIRKLEAAIQKPGGGNLAVFIPGHPDPTPEDVAQAVGVLRIIFVRPGYDEAGPDARH